MENFKCLRQCDNCKYHIDPLYACGENECMVGIKPTDPLRNENGCIYTERQLKIISDAIEDKANAALKPSYCEWVESDAEKQAFIDAQARKYSDLIFEIGNVREMIRMVGPQNVVLNFRPDRGPKETVWRGVEKIDLDLYEGYLYVWSYGKKDTFMIPSRIRIENQ